MSHCARAIGLAVIALLAAGCRSTPPPTPTRISSRQELMESVGFPCRAQEQQALPTEYTEAAARGLDWLMHHQQALQDSPYPNAIRAIAFCAASRDPRMHMDPEFRSHWMGIIDAILAQQDSRGRLSRARPTVMPYEHAWATRAVWEAMGLEQTPGRWLPQAQKAIRYILDHQQPTGGWHYGYATGRQRSTPLTVIQMDALFAAHRSGATNPEIALALQRAADDLQAIQDLRSGHFGYLMRGVGTATMDAYALYGLQLAGRWHSPAYRRGWLARMEAGSSWPETLQHPLFAAYYAHKSTFWHGGLPWRQWQDHFHQELLSGQLAAGDWPAPRAEAAFGRAYATAFASLMLGIRQEPPLASNSLPKPVPGPVYEVNGGTGTVRILLSTAVEALDGVLLDPVIAAHLQTADAVWIEGSVREWIHHWSELAGQAPDQPLPQRSREHIAFLTDWFDIPRTVPSRIWNEIPAWALAAAVVGRGLEKSDRLPDSTVESAVARRLAPGMRSRAIVPATLYGDRLQALSIDQQEILLAHAIRIAPQLTDWADQAADAWVRADEHGLSRWYHNMIGSDPGLAALFDEIARPARTRFLLHLLHAIESDASTWFVIPAWHWFGPEGIREELEKQGYCATITFQELPQDCAQTPLSI